MNFQYVDFSCYRENGLEIWGTKGRPSIVNDCRVILHDNVRKNKGLSNAKEVACDEMMTVNNDFGDAFYNMYDNLADAMNKNIPLIDPVKNALNHEKIIRAIINSSKKEGQLLGSNNYVGYSIQP